MAKIKANLKFWIHNLKFWPRWKLALFLNRYADTCWADLVCWAVYPENHGFSEVFHMRNRAGCCEQSGCYNYCGKCDQTVGVDGVRQWKESHRKEQAADMTEALNEVKTK